MLVLWLLPLYHIWSLFLFLFVTYQLYHNTDSILRYLSQNTAVPIDRLKTEYYKVNKGLLYGEYTHEDIWDSFCANVGCDIDYNILVESFRNTPLDHNMISLVKELKKSHLIGMITDNKCDRINEILLFHNLESQFDVVSVSAAYKCGKNDRLIFDQTLEELNVNASECVFIDNSAKNLIVPARIGIHTILFDDEKRDIDAFRYTLQELLLN